MNNDMNQYLAMFIEESKDNLQRLNEYLLELEKNPSDKKMVNEIFRVAHTLKGMSGTMGFVNMQKLTHVAENVLDAIRNDLVVVDADLLDVLFSSLDALEQYVEEIINSGNEGTQSYSNLIVSLESLIQEQKPQPVVITPPPVQIIENENTGIVLLPDVEEKAKQKQKDGFNIFEVTVCLHQECLLKGARGFLLGMSLSEVCEILDSTPSAKDIEEEKFDLEIVYICATKLTKEQICKAALDVSEIEKATAVTIDLNKTPKVNIVSEPKNIDTETKSKVNQKNTKENFAIDEHSTSTTDINVSMAQDVQLSDKDASKPQIANKTVRVNIDRLDTLMNLVSELIIIKTQLEGVGKSYGDVLDTTVSKENNIISSVNRTEGQSNYNESIEYLERITTNLHDAVMKVRMVPIETVFNRFPRMIRDVSRKLNKDIEFHISGEDTELDRTVIDEIGDPLIHLLRNAADHGLETKEERLKANKSTRSNIYLRAFQDGNNVVIEVEDDGRGINVQKIKAKAIEKGVTTKEAADTMTDQEIIELLFSPSFSTSEVVTDLSGRGVGLDVVKSKISTLGGNVTVKTKLGEGSKFIIRLPLTLAIIQALMVNIGTEQYAIPLNNIQNIESIQKGSIKKVQKQEVVMLRDLVIPIIRLHDVLDIQPNNTTDELIVVIVKKNERYTGFIVDSLIGQQEIVIKSLGRYMGSLDMIAGATILGNGEVALILDINTLA